MTDAGGVAPRAGLAAILAVVAIITAGCTDTRPRRATTVRAKLFQLDSRLMEATIALSSGISPHVVSRRLGHANITVTLGLYAHLLPGDDEAAAVTNPVTTA